MFTKKERIEKLYDLTNALAILNNEELGNNEDVRGIIDELDKLWMAMRDENKKHNKKTAEYIAKKRVKNPNYAR